MRDGYLEILVKEGERVLSEVVFDRKTYVEATAGAEFSVEVRIHMNDEGFFPYNIAITDLFIDGIKSNNRTTIHLDDYFMESCYKSKVFTGYSWGEKAFQFGDLLGGPTASSSSSARAVSRLETIGSIQVKLWEAEVRDIPIVGSNNRTFTAKRATIPKVPEVKAFWQAPSLSATPGRNLRDKPVVFGSKHKTKRKECDREITVFYHSKETLKNMRTLEKIQNTTYSVNENHEVFIQTRPVRNAPIIIRNVAGMRRKLDSLMSVLDQAEESKRVATNSGSSAESGNNSAGSGGHKKSDIIDLTADDD